LYDFFVRKERNMILGLWENEKEGLKFGSLAYVIGAIGMNAAPNINLMPSF